MRTEDLEAILDAAEGVPTAPKPADAVSDERVAEIRERLLTEGDALAIWLPSPEVDSLVSDLLAGVEMNPSLFGLAMKAARLGHSAETIAAHLSALLDASDAQAKRPDRLAQIRQDLPKLVARAVATAGASLNTPYVPATEDLPPVEDDDTPLDPRERMFRDFVWCERLKKIVEIATGAALDQTQFDTRCYEVGPSGHRSLSPWMIFRNRGDLRRNVDGLTFRPGQGRLIEEDGVGLCVNTWTPLSRVMPPAPDDEAVKVFLDHAAFVIPDDGERKIVLDWMAWVAQHQDEKPNWALVLGSTNEGVGKDLLLNPLRYAIDRLYVREISAGELVSGFNGWMDRCKLVIVQEMENFERRRTANLLKPLISSPPEFLRVNEKGIVPYQIPNIMAAVFFTNEENAVQISNGDRRYFVSWNDAKPRSASYYQKLVAWMENGGAALAAAWLLARDVSAFDSRGRAPESQAKTDMRKASRSPLMAWLEDSIADAVPPFDVDLVALEDIRAQVPMDAVGGRHVAKPSSRAISAALRKLGVPVSERMRMGQRTAYTTDDRMCLAIVRRQEMYYGLVPDKLRELFWSGHEKAGKQRIYNGASFVQA